MTFQGEPDIVRTTGTWLILGIAAFFLCLALFW